MSCPETPRSTFPRITRATICCTLTFTSLSSLTETFYMSAIGCNANTLVLKSRSVVHGQINWHWPPLPHIWQLFAQFDKYLHNGSEKFAQNTKYGRDWHLLKNRPSVEGRDPIRGRQHWLEDMMTWENCCLAIIHFSRLTSSTQMVLIPWGWDVSFSAACNGRFHCILTM